MCIIHIYMHQREVQWKLISLLVYCYIISIVGINIIVIMITNMFIFGSMTSLT